MISDIGWFMITMMVMCVSVGWVLRSFLNRGE